MRHNPSDTDITFDLCSEADLIAGSGVCVLCQGRQIALFYLPDENPAVYGIDNWDPIGKANVLSRGIVGDSNDELVVSSPLYKQHFSLRDGHCLEQDEVEVDTYDVELIDGRVILRMRDLTTSCTQTTCPYCGVGCGVVAVMQAGDVVSVKGSPTHPANAGRLCVKGSALRETLTPNNRLLYPQVHGQRVDWDTAVTAVADGLRTVIDQHGPDAVAFYLSGQLLTEDYYVANKLMKGFIGSGNVDTNSRLCMASAVVGYKRAFGADAVPCNYEDLELCDLLLLIGSNAAWAHPVLYQRIAAAKAARPEMKVVVLDPRRTASCEIADLHLQIRPGSDAFLFNGLLHYLYEHKAFNTDFVEEHCNNLQETLASVATCSLDAVADIAGVAAVDLQQFYSWFANTEKTLSFYSQGVNQSTSGADKCNAIINCHLATGRIGRPGMGPFSITGQPNAMGGREVGGLATQLAAHMDFNAENCARVGRFWRSERVAQQPGLKAVDLFDAIGTGRIKAVWIMATNPVVSLPDSERIKAALNKCELVIVSDCAEHTDTNTCATILLPAAGWGEKEGTVTNSERRISRQRALLPPIGEARPDWQIVCDVARKLGFAEAFAYNCARDIFVEHAALSGFENANSRAFDISALAQLTEAEYAGLQPLQWPVNNANPQGCARLFGDSHFYTANGRANLVPVNAALPALQTGSQYPFRLNTGRLRDQWHTMTRTGNVERLLLHSDAPSASLHPDDIAALNTAEGELLAITSTQGRLLVPVKSDEGLMRGDVFVPIHWNRQFSKHATVNTLFSARVDPWSGQPESKLEAVQLATAAMSEWFIVISQRALRPDGFDYWHKVPIRGGFRYLLGRAVAADTPPAGDEFLQQLAPGFSFATFHHSETGDPRYLCLTDVTDGTPTFAGTDGTPTMADGMAGGTLTIAVFRSQKRSQLPDAAWLNGLLGTEPKPNHWLFTTGSPPDDSNTGAIICTCWEVGELPIRAAIAAGAQDHVQLGRRLSCGTKCGSCIPELRRLLREAQEEPVTSAAA